MVELPVARLASRLHGRQGLAGQAAAADGVERQGRAGRRYGIGELCRRSPASVESTTHSAPWSPHSFSWAELRTTFTSGDAVGFANSHEHLAEVGSGRGMDEGLVAFAAHRLDHAERR